MKKRFSSFTVFVSLSFLVGFFFILVSTPTAGEIEKNFREYLKSLSPDEFAPAIVIMADQADIKALNASLKMEKATMKVRHQRVLSALQAAASRSQVNMVSYLEARKKEGSVKGYTRFWIMNLIVVQATRKELEKIAARSDVEIVEENFRVSLIEPVGERTKSVEIPSKGIGITPGLRAINAPRVWHELGITGLGRLVGNIDTGVDGAHPALTNRWRGNYEPWQECWRDAVGFGDTTPHDYYGHGTHVMGTLCGLGAGTGDTIGVAWEAEWIADNAIDQEVGPEIDNDILDAFQWFADPDGNPATIDDVPDVVQNSWGVYSYWPGYQDCDYRWQAVIENCEAAGVVVTFSAGNEGPYPQTLRSPANICNTPTTNFAIGAVDATHYGFPYPIADLSSRGPSDCDGVTKKPEVVAPGVQVYSSVPGGGYEQYGWTGTSMAGPHVAGVVALIRQANPDLDVDSIKQILINTAVDLGVPGEDNNYGWGIIDAYAAVLQIMVIPGCRISYTNQYPESWSVPPIKVPSTPGFRIIRFTIMSIGNLGGTYAVRSDDPNVQVTLNPGPQFLEPGDQLPVEIEINCAGDTLLETYITITTCIGTADEDSVKIPLIAVCGNDYYECVRDPATQFGTKNGTAGSPFCSLWTCSNSQEKLWDLRLPTDSNQIIFSGGVIVAFMDDSAIVGRQDYRDTKTGARDTIRVIKSHFPPEFDCDVQKIFVTKTYVWYPPEIPATPKWYWLNINKQIILFSNRSGKTCPAWKKQQVIKHVWITWGSPPAWWPNEGSYTGHPDIYYGVYADINAPFDTGCHTMGGESQSGCNVGGWDATNKMVWQSGYGGVIHPEYANYYVGLGLTNTAGQIVTPMGCKDVRNAEYLYPQSGWGWQDSQLYRLASTALDEGTVVDNPDSVVDRSAVMTAGMIPAGSTTNFVGEFILIESFSRTSLDELKTNIGKARMILIPELKYGGVLDKTFPTGPCGDVTGDRLVDAADVVYLVNYLYLHGPKPPWIVADINGDATIDGADVVYLVNYLYIHAPPLTCYGL
ncbi:MAG: S8 family serine peptidase [candidate division Zixibacteria bacterium]|nr:S8 family serine peptidase [candidate division Zixibacteria bacterium]